MNANTDKLVELWISHNSFLWQQVRALPFVEAIILAGTYKLYKDNEFGLALSVFIFGSFLLFILFLMLRRHILHARKFRDDAGAAIPKPEGEPFLGLRSDTLAMYLPLILVIFHVILLLVILCK